MPFWSLLLVFLCRGQDHSFSAATGTSTACNCSGAVAPTQIWTVDSGYLSPCSDLPAVELPSLKGPAVPGSNWCSHDAVRAMEMQVLCPYGERNYSVLWRLPWSLESMQRRHLYAQAEEAGAELRQGSSYIMYLYVMVCRFLRMRM